MTEYCPKTGQVRTLYESSDCAGNVNRIHCKLIDGQNNNSQDYSPTKVELETLSNTKRTQVMYTKEQFGRELKEKSIRKESIIEIGIWSFSMYWQHIEDIDLDFRSVLLTLGKMELGPEFAFTYEELNKIADDLISGRSVNLG